MNKIFEFNCNEINKNTQLEMKCVRCGKSEIINFGIIINKEIIIKLSQLFMHHFIMTHTGCIKNN